VKVIVFSFLLMKNGINSFKLMKYIKKQHKFNISKNEKDK